MSDWITWTIEAVGIVIFFIWIIVPVGEFKTIYRHLATKAKSHGGPQR